MELGFLVISFGLQPTAAPDEGCAEAAGQCLGQLLDFPTGLCHRQILQPWGLPECDLWGTSAFPAKGRWFPV